MAIPSKSSKRRSSAATARKQQRTKWTTSEDTKLKDLRAKGYTWEQIAPKLPGRDGKSCERRYGKLLPAADRFRSKQLWTIDEDRKLTDLCARRLGWDAIAKELPGRTELACKTRHSKRRGSRKRWTVKEKEDLKKWRREEVSWEVISSKLGRTVDACQQQHNSIIGVRQTGIWTPDEDDILQEARKNLLTWKQISTRLPGRSPKACKDHYHTLLPVGERTNLRRVWEIDEKKTLVQLRALGQAWDAIAKEIPGRSAIACERQYDYCKGLADSLKLPFRATKKRWTSTESQILVDLRLDPNWTNWIETMTRTKHTMNSCKAMFSGLQNDARAIARGSSMTEALEDNRYPQYLRDILDKWGCRKCSKIIEDLPDHELFCSGNPSEDLVCVDCRKDCEDTQDLINHYSIEHGCNIREQGVEGRWADLNPHLLPQLDLSSGYGSQLTRRPVVSGEGADPEIRQLWIDFTNSPARFDGPQKKRLLTKYRAEFKGLFRATPVRFHAHVSDINPPSILSLLQTLARSAGSSIQTRALKVSQEIPTFACTYGVYGASYGQGASISHIKEFNKNAAGKRYFEIMTADEDKHSVLSQLRKAKAQGCFALLIEVVRWMDGRVMPASEWATIHQACRQLNMILIVDETLSLLRCGAPFAYQLEQYKGSPDLIFFGKGLVTSGVAIDSRGLWISKLKLGDQGMETADDEFSLVSDVLETGVLIRSMGIIRMARIEDWSSRGLRIGEILLSFAKDLNKSTRELRINGLGSLLYFDAKDVAHHGLQVAGAGRNKLRWIPVLDEIMQDPEKLRLKMFGPLSLAHRALLGHLMTKAGIFPSVCSACGHKSELGGDFCRQCCVMTCGPCGKRSKHACILRVGTDS